jgi:hypothetical protein
MSASFSCRWSAVVIGLLVVPGFALSAPAPSSKETASKAEKIRKALDQTVTLDQGDLPLQQALERLRDQIKVDFVVDRATIQLMGIDDGELPINLNLQKVKACSALRIMLSQYNLGYVIIGDTVTITSEEMALYRQVRQRVDVELERVPLSTALQQLARETATNLVVDPRATKESLAPVTLNLHDVPLEVAVRLMAEMAGLKPVRIGNVLFVTTKANAIDLRTDGDTGPPGPPNGNGFDSLPLPSRKVVPAALPLQLPPGGPAAAPAPPPAPAEASKPEKPNQ